MTDKQKNITLIIGFISLLVISYVFAIKKTSTLKSRLETQKKEKELLANASSRIFNLQQEDKYLDSILQKKELSIEYSFQQTLFKKINDFSKNKIVEIIAFDEPHEILQNKTKISTYHFKIKGEYSSLLQLVNLLEKSQLGKIISLNIEKKKNYKTNRNELIGTFYLQKLSKEK